MGTRQWLRDRQVPARTRTLWVLVLLVIYGLLFDSLARTQASALYLAAAQPVVAGGALVGLRLALLISLALVPVHTVLFNVLGRPGWDAALVDGGGLAHVLIGLLGIVVGALRELLVRARAVADEQRELRGRLVEQQRALEDRARLEGVLLAARTAQHELNNRLALTVGYAELLANDPRLPDMLRGHALEALRGAMEAAELVNSLRNVTRLDHAPLAAGVEAILDLRPAAAAESPPPGPSQPPDDGSAPSPAPSASTPSPGYAPRDVGGPRDGDAGP